MYTRLTKPSKVKTVHNSAHNTYRDVPNIMYLQGASICVLVLQVYPHTVVTKLYPSCSHPVRLNFKTPITTHYNYVNIIINSIDVLVIFWQCNITMQFIVYVYCSPWPPLSNEIFRTIKKIFSSTFKTFTRR